MDDSRDAAVSPSTRRRDRICSTRRAALVASLCLAATSAAWRSAGAQRIDTASVLGALRDASSACAGDAGALWSRSLCGPIAFVDRQTRLAVVNDSVASRALLPYGGAFVTTLPASVGLANTSFEWDGRQWAMILLPLPADRFDRIALVMHEVFHREQRALGLSGSDPANNHLDEREGRRWLRLELNALAAALDALAARGDARRHAESAMLFRQRRQLLFPNADSLEAALEMQEGLAEYTGDRMAMALTGESAARVARRVRDFQATPSYVRSFAYGTGPALGLLLDEFRPAWRTELPTIRNPARLLATALGVRASRDLASIAERRALAYGGNEIAAQERVRDSVRSAATADYRRRLVDGPVLTVRQTNLNRNFNPNALVGFDAASTVYPTGSFSADWGALEVTERGALVSNDFTWIRVSAPPSVPAATDHVVKGDGWTLTLKPGWVVRPSHPERGSLEVVKEQP